MLRQRVLESWKKCKEKILNGEKLLNELNDRFVDMTYSCDGLSIKQHPYQVLEEIKEMLPSIVQDCQKLRDEYTNSQFGICSDQVKNTYLIYTGLVETYKKIIEYYDQD
jgi:Ni,Fe-hydrogenase III component G